MHPHRPPTLPLLALAACGYTRSPSSAPSPSDARVDEAATTAQPNGAPSTTQTLTVISGAHARTVIVHAPSNRHDPAPLVFNLHGSGGTAEDQRSTSATDLAADAHGFIVAYPQGEIAVGAGFAWNVPGQPLVGGAAVPEGASDDVAFVADAIGSISHSYIIDPRRVYIAGFSGGARMTSQLGCDLASRVAAIAAVAGLRFPDPCSSERAVPVVAFHGTADSVNPYGGGGPGYWTYSVPDAAARWALHDGCLVGPETSIAAPGVTLTRYTGCAAAAEVELFTTEGADHVWPATTSAAAIDASELMWAFFSTHPLP